MFPSSRRLQLDVEQTTEIYCVIMTFSSDTILNFTTYTNKSDLQQKNASLFIKVIFSIQLFRDKKSNLHGYTSHNECKKQSVRHFSYFQERVLVNLIIFNIHKQPHNSVITDERDWPSKGALIVVIEAL